MERSDCSSRCRFSFLTAFPAYADKCDALVPTNAQSIDEGFKGKADGEVKGLLGKLAGGAASIDGEYRKLVSDELQHYPEANKLYVWQRIMYLACISPDLKIDANDLFRLDPNRASGNSSKAK